MEKVTGDCETQGSLKPAASVPGYTEVKAAASEMALNLLSIPPSYHGLIIQRIPLKTGLVPAEPLKTLAPSKSKLNTIEAKRIMSVLDEAINKVELITLMSYLESHPEALEDALPENFVEAIREHLDIGQALVEKASTLQRKQKELEKGEEAEEDWDQERLLSIELHKTNLWPLTHQFRDSTKTILRLLINEPQLTRLLHTQAPGRSPGAQCLLTSLVELRGFLFEKLLTSPMEVREKNQFIQDISRRSKRNQEIIDALQAELAEVLKNKEAEVEKENFVIQELKNHLHQVFKFSENSLLRTKQEAEKQQKVDYRASQARQAKTQQDILALRAQYHNLVMENREAEQALRKKKYKVETEIENWIQKYDMEMNEKQAPPSSGSECPARMAAGRRVGLGPRSHPAMAPWKKKRLRKRRTGASQARDSDSEDGEFEIQAEDDARARKLGPGRALPSFPTSECVSDVEPDTREMVRAQNKKKKKSGGFQSMGLSYPVFKGIMKKGYKVPTPIQRKTIPVILDGKDVVAMARTGSGKTACFLLPMFERLKARSAQTGARALILSPTRELALQTMKFTKELGKFTGLKTALILGGDKMEDQFAALHENPDIIIATPGRLVHVAVEMNLKLQSVEYVVFDEADRLFEMGFAEQLQEIIGRLPGGHQTVLFSATLPKLLVEFARAGLTEPVLIRLDVDSKLNEQLKTSFFLVREDTKTAVLLYLLQNVVRPQDQNVVFVATKHHAEYLTELLTGQGVSCAHIYSALDQTARKINLAKFTHNKCSTLIVTDLAARGLDIPLLDNVINYSFPAKGKLFLHRVGRVARAGRSGTAYSLVAPDEVPYLLDLHLFLGRSVTLARPHEEPSSAGAVGRDGVLGRVPQSVVDDEDSSLQTALQASLELQGLQRVANNAQQQYLRSRPAPSPESIKRAKELDLAELGLHPLFSSCFEEGELQRLRLVDSIKNYRTRTTIFEINASSKDPSSQMMRAKRQRDRKAITSFHQGRQERQDGPADPVPQRELPQKEEEDMVETVEGVFTEVVGQKQPRPGPNQGAKRRRKEASQRDQEFYVPYRPKDFDSERGLSVSGAGGAFEQQVAGAVLDLMGDEAQNMSRGRQQLKWDRKKKRFVGQSGQEDKKKIKTESGRFISSSYKRDLYQKWKQKQKIDDRDSEEEGPSNRRGPGPHRGGKRGRSQGASQSRASSVPTGHMRSELKTKEQILKQRRQAQKQRFLQRGGLKQLSARNRRRAQELRQSAFGRGAPTRKGKMRKRM